VREARDEAKKEIEAYRVNKEAEFKEFEAEVLPTDSQCAGEMLTAAAHTRQPGS
jgi:V-type H+-transporting ATPase subunit G